MSTPEVEIRAPKSRREFAAMVSLTMAAFNCDDARRRRMFRTSVDNPEHPAKLSRVLFAAGQMVAAVQVQDLTLHIGDAALRTAGIAWVATHPNHRRRGYGRMLMSEVVEFCKRDGFDISLLFGIRDYYHRFGYVPALCHVQFEVPTAALAAPAGALQCTPMNTSDESAVRRIKERQVKQLTLAIQRADWQWRLLSAHRRRVRVVRDGSKIVGYYHWAQREQEVEVSEVGAADVAVFQAIAGDLHRRARHAGVETVRFAMPADLPFAQWIVRFGARMTVNYPCNGSGMGRLVDVESALRRMVPEWQRRLSATASAIQPFAFAFVTDIGTAAVVCADNRIEVRSTGGRRIKLPQTALTQLLFGYRTVRSICTEHHVRLLPVELTQLDFLFPHRLPTVWRGDGF